MDGDNQIKDNDEKEEKDIYDEDSDSDEKRKEQMDQVDYGFKEKAYVLPQDDCFTKMFQDIKADSG